MGKELEKKEKRKEKAKYLLEIGIDRSTPLVDRSIMNKISHVEKNRSIDPFDQSIDQARISQAAYCIPFPSSSPPLLVLLFFLSLKPQ